MRVRVPPQVPFHRLAIVKKEEQWLRSWGIVFIFFPSPRRHGRAIVVTLSVEIRVEAQADPPSQNFIESDIEVKESEYRAVSSVGRAPDF